MCFVVFSASGSGGFCGFDLDGGLGPVVVFAGFVIVVDVGAAGVEGVVCFPRRRRVTGINAEVAEA